MKSQAAAAEAGSDADLGREGLGTFEQVVREHRSMVFSLACYFLHDAAVAEELAQDVFLKLFLGLRSIQSAEHLVCWLRRVTYHRCIDYARGENKRQWVALDEIAEPWGSGNHPDPLLSRTLQRLVASLPDKARMAVILRFQEDLDYEEIAEVMEIPLNTVKSVLKRSLRLLHGKLERAMKGVNI
ncbi:MAG: RNA polymerase sigma factor [Terriglobia bacterium]